jgi:hypothetical protein
MRKNWLQSLLAASALVAAFAVPCSAVTITTIGYNDADPGIRESRSAWQTVVEMENYGTDSRITAANSYVYAPAPTSTPWLNMLWIYGEPGFGATSFFNTPASSLFVQFAQSDSNDGIADFYIDGAKVYSIDAKSAGDFAVVFTDLAYAAHTLTVDTPTYGHVHLDAMGAGAPSAVPEPGTALLLAGGLVGICAFRRRRASN